MVLPDHIFFCFADQTTTEKSGLAKPAISALAIESHNYILNASELIIEKYARDECNHVLSFEFVIIFIIC